MSTTINLRRAKQQERRLGAIEASLRREYFEATDSVIGLFTQSPGEAEKAMRSETLWDRPQDVSPSKKAVKLYDAETGATAALQTKKETEDEFPCLRAVLMGIVIGTAALMLVSWFVGIVV